MANLCIFQLKPFVTENKQKQWGTFDTVAGAQDPQLYLAKWKNMNAVN